MRPDVLLLSAFFYAGKLHLVSEFGGERREAEVPLGEGDVEAIYNTLSRK